MQVLNKVRCIMLECAISPLLIQGYFCHSAKKFAANMFTIIDPQEPILMSGHRLALSLRKHFGIPATHRQ